MELFIIQMLIQILQSGGQSKQNIQLSKQLWLALHRDSRYICDSRYDVQDSTVWCKKTRHV